MSWNESSTSQTFPYFGGTLEIGIAMACDVGKDQCSLTATMHILRYTVYRQTINGVSYSGSSYEDSYYTWHCVNGVPQQKSAYGTDSGKQDVTNGSGQTIATVEVGATGGNSQGGASGRVFQNGGWGPTMSIAAPGFSTSCCNFG